ncbi:MAG: hypothetical protein HY332_20165 [Chloroflexi bacterium]|nr:hypothetical protein [Chloroflexota bacterium]
MVMVTVEDVQRVEQVEQELATAGRERERTAVHKALTLLRRAAIEQLERSAGVESLPPGRLPAEGEPPVRILDEAEQRRLEALLDAGKQGKLSAAERHELQRLLDTAEEGAMRNVLALVRTHAPDPDVYARALRAYKRSFARFRTSVSTAKMKKRATDLSSTRANG